MLHERFTALCGIDAELIGDGIFTLRGSGYTQASVACVPVVDLFRSCDLDLDPITLLTRIAWRYTGCANMNFPHEVFRKLSSDIQTAMTDIQNRPKLYSTPIRGNRGCSTIYIEVTPSKSKLSSQIFNLVSL